MLLSVTQTRSDSSYLSREKWKEKQHIYYSDISPRTTKMHISFTPSPLVCYKCPIVKYFPILPIGLTKNLEATTTELLTQRNSNPQRFTTVKSFLSYYSCGFFIFLVILCSWGKGIGSFCLSDLDQNQDFL